MAFNRKEQLKTVFEDTMDQSKRLTTTPLYTKQALSKKAEGLRFIRHP